MPTSVTQRRSQQRSEARRVILDAAEAIIVDAGYEAFSIRRLVDRCGYSAPTIYHYFGDKKGLIDALVEERFAQLVLRLRAVPQSEDTVDNLRRLFLAFAQFGLENPTHYRLLMTPRGEESEPMPSAEEAERLCLGPLQQLEQADRLGNAGLDRIRQTFWSFLHGLISLQSSRLDQEWVDDLLESGLDVLIRGCIDPSPEAADSRSSGLRAVVPEAP